MTMLLADIGNRGNIPVLEKLLAFTEARHEMIAENIANIDTPAYKTKQLDVAAFQESLRRAIDERGYDPHKSLTLEKTPEFHMTDRGFLRVTPSQEPVDNILFHDRTNARIEQHMVDLTENTLVYRIANELLSTQFAGLKVAIRGQV